MVISPTSTPESVSGVADKIQEKEAAYSSLPPTTAAYLRPRSMSNELIIDDNDRQFSYKGEWEIYRSTTDQQWMRTAHSTWEFDATATLTFTGTQIKVYGTVPAGRGTSAVDFSIDGHNGERVWHTSGSTTLYGVLFYHSGPLNSGSHTIVMSNKGEDNDMDFRLDRVVISQGDIAVTPSQQTTDGNLPPTTTTPSPSSASTPSSPTARPSSTSLSLSIGSSTDLSSSLSPSSTVSHSFTSFGTSLSTSSTTPTLAPGANPAQATETIMIAKEKSEAPIIAGAVVGTVVFLAVLGALLFIFVRKNRYAHRIPESPEQPPPPMLSTSSLVSPFTDPQSNNNSANAPLGDNFTTKPVSSSRLGRQTAATLSYIGSAASRGNPSESESPSTVSPIQSEKHSPLFNTSVTTTDLNSANNSRDDYPYRDLERPPSYAPTPLLSRDPPSAS